MRGLTAGWLQLNLKIGEPWDLGKLHELDEKPRIHGERDLRPSPTSSDSTSTVLISPINRLQLCLNIGYPKTVQWFRISDVFFPYFCHILLVGFPHVPTAYRQNPPVLGGIACAQALSSRLWAQAEDNSLGQLHGPVG